jgi:prevent-host-death family protein
MKRVKISELKAHLSQYINEVRDGETIIVCDRNRPVVELRPLSSEPAALVLRGRQNPAALRALFERSPSRIAGLDAVRMLREDRDSEWDWLDEERGQVGHDDAGDA